MLENSNTGVLRFAQDDSFGGFSIACKAPPFQSRGEKSGPNLKTFPPNDFTALARTSHRPAQSPGEPARRSLLIAAQGFAGRAVETSGSGIRADPSPRSELALSAANGAGSEG